MDASTVCYITIKFMQAFITSLRPLFGSFWDVSIALVYFITHLIIIAVYPIVFLSAALCINVKVIAGRISRQKPLDRLFTQAEQYLDEVDIKSSSDDESLSNAVPSIPLYMIHHGCEFSLSSVTAKSVAARRKKEHPWGDRQIAELHMGGHSNLNTAGCIKAMLEYHCHEHPLDMGMLEMGERIYSGPAEWILKVMEDDAARYAAALESHVPDDEVPDDAATLESHIPENGAPDDAETEGGDR